MSNLDTHFVFLWTNYPASRDNRRGRKKMSFKKHTHTNDTHPSVNLEIIITGPKDSSCAMNMWSSTSVKTVGSRKKPERNKECASVENAICAQVLGRGWGGLVLSTTTITKAR